MRRLIALAAVGIATMAIVACSGEGSFRISDDPSSAIGQSTPDLDATVLALLAIAETTQADIQSTVEAAIEATQLAGIDNSTTIEPQVVTATAMVAPKTTTVSQTAMVAPKTTTVSQTATVTVSQTATVAPKTVTVSQTATPPPPASTPLPSPTSTPTVVPVPTPLPNSLSLNEASTTFWKTGKERRS